MLNDILIYILSFGGIWFGAGLIVRSIDGFSRKLKISTFALSFFVLGILTSIPEFAVSLTAVKQGTPEIFVGLLLGGVNVIFLFVIPILAVLGNGIKLTNQLDRKTLIFSLCVIAAPSLLILDRKVTNLEGAILIGLYAALFFFIQHKKGLFSGKNEQILALKSYSLFDILKLIAGIGLVFLASQYIVDRTVLFSTVLGVSPFLVSLLVLGLGTNLPELSLAIRSVTTGKKDIAFGDYIGSAAANTLFFGIFTILNEGEVLTASPFFTTFVFITLGTALFYFFARSGRVVTKKEGFMLLGVYIIFLIVEIVKGS